MAVTAGIESAVQIHIDRGDDLNARDGNGFTVLMLAAARNKVAICKLLLSAGADTQLLDPSGKTAHAIAVAARAYEVVAVLEETSSCVEAPQAQDPSSAHVPSTSSAIQPSSSDRNASLFVTHAVGAPELVAPMARISTEITPSVQKSNVTDLGELADRPDFSLFGWEAEEEVHAPEVDPAVAELARAIQASISKHEPIDSSEDWEDLDIYLPERSLALARAEDAEARELLRLLLLRAVREGSVPSAAVEALSVNDDRSPSPEAEALLTMVITDLGAEVDDRFEYVSADENFEVFVNPEEHPDEAEKVANALAFIDNLASRYSEPLRLYQKEFQREKLITAEEEVSLGKAMESALEQALDVLAAWPQGIALTLAAGSLVETGRKPLTWLSLGPVELQPNLESESLGDGDSDGAPPVQGDEDVDIDDEAPFDPSASQDTFASEFADALTLLAALPTTQVDSGPTWQTARSALAPLRLNRRFLIDLADAKNDTDTDTGLRYAGAIQAYREARDRMASANLKLVFHQAKKYLYSGEPLDDLAQEGNLGLLKAVDRYDWRRGFKFSTYATWWIRQHIGRYIGDKCRTIRLPVHIHEQVQRVTRETSAFELEHRRAPSLDEIAVRLGLNARKVSQIRRLATESLRIHDLPIDEMISIDAQSDFASPDPFESAVTSDVSRTVRSVLKTLKPKEAQILRLRFGIEIPDSLTLDDIGQRYDVTRERVRQIEAKALRMLMQPSRVEPLSRVFFGHSYDKGPKGLEGHS